MAKKKKLSMVISPSDIKITDGYHTRTILRDMNKVTDDYHTRLSEITILR